MKQRLGKKPFLLASAVPCAHCDSPFNSLRCHGQARHDGTPFNLLYQVGCEACHAMGPITKTASEAIAAWEHRTGLTKDVPETGFQDIHPEEQTAYRKGGLPV